MVHEDSERKKRGFPKKLFAFTVLVASGLLIVHWKSSFLNERFNMTPDLPWMYTILLSLATLLMWIFWAFFLAKLRWLGLLILVVPTVFLTLFMPNFSGDMKISGWKPRFWKSAVNFVEVKSKDNPGIDLQTTSSTDFPQFLGVNRNGVVDGLRLSKNWSQSPPKILWKQPVGEGWSGFAAVNGFAITQEQRESEECVTCYDVRTGELKWIYSSHRRNEDTMALGKVGPRATPTIHQGMVYATSGTGVLDCLDGSTGTLVWSVDIPQLVGIKQVPNKNSRGLDYTMEDSNLMWGRSCSPLVFEEKVIVTAGGPTIDPDNQTVTLIAVDKKTGAEIWRGGNRMVAYGSPSLATLLSKPQLLLVAENRAVGHDLESGAELWSHERPGISNADANCSQVTPVTDSKLILSKGYGLGGELIELKDIDGKIQVSPIHKDSRILKTKLTSPVMYQGHAYSLSDGYLECTEAETFQRKWKQRGRFGNGQLLLVGDKLLVHSEDGLLLLVAADPAGYQEYGSIKTINGICWNTICLSGNHLLVRSELEAACLELPTD